jgi:hypothetical protein
MKKICVVVFFMLSLFALSLVGTAAAGNPDFTHIAYQSAESQPTIDGMYAPGPEWLPSGTQTFGTNGIFRDMWIYPDGFGGTGYVYLLIETGDTTDNAGDSWTMCFDSADTMGDDPDGGPSPQTNDYKIVVTGHGASQTIQWFKGNGTGWNPIATPPTSFAQMNQSCTVSPKIGVPHWILECKFDKTDATTLGTSLVSYLWNFYCAYNDTEPGGYGLQSWPPASATPPGSPNVPDSWGTVTYEMNENPTPDIPENISIAVMLAVSSVAVAGVVLLRKRQRIANL